MLARETIYLTGLLTAAAVDGLLALAAWRRSGSCGGRTILLAGTALYALGCAMAVLFATSGLFLVLSVAAGVGGWTLFRRRSPLTGNRVLESLGEGVLVLDAGNRIADFNPAARSMLRCLTPRARGRPAAEVLREHPALVAELLSPGGRQLDVQLPWGKGLKCYQVRVSRLKRGRRLVGKAVVFRDVTPETWRMDELEAKARIDALTGVYNRGHFLEMGRREMERAARAARPLAVILLDIDHFKEVNDTYGHDAGDTALKAVAATCAGALRSRDLLGRWGGEEFAVVLPGTSPEEACLVAERMRQEIAARRVVLDRTVTVELTASFGVAGRQRTTRDTSLEDLFKAADAALYRAKNSGRNRVARS